MDKCTIPPSPNWQLSKVLACSDEGLLAYGSRGEVSIIKLEKNGKIQVVSLNLAHKDKVNVVVFSPSIGTFKNCLATCGDDGMVRVWDFQECHLLYCHSGHKDGVKVMGLDWSRADINRIVSVNDLGCIVCWDLASNTIRKLHSGIKSLPLCLACCLHDKDIIAIGCKSGVTLVINIKGSGKIIYRLRGHEQDVISVSWCPVPFNVFKYKRSNDEEEISTRERELLLATGGQEKSIFIWRTSSDGRFEVVLNLPNTNLSNNYPRKKGYAGVGASALWTCVHWVDANTLLSSSQFGELLLWDLNQRVGNNRNHTKKYQPRLLHSCHHKGLFSIACPVLYDTLQYGKADERIVWTTAMDKHVVGCSLESGKTLIDIPTLGGTVFCMAFSPLDPNRLAIGSSDSKIFVWNMSDLHSLNITTYWKKIIGKVMALCWHPLEENWLAYGTSDGHIGLLDVGSNKVPTLFRLHHRKAVYRLCWASPLLKDLRPNVAGDSKLVLYSLGDGDVFQYKANPQDSDAEPESLNSMVLNEIDKSLGLQKSLVRSDIVFKPDLSCFAVGSENGSVYIIDYKTLNLKNVIYPHKKLMNNLEWHPETVACNNEISPFRNWLATSCDNIKVYNLPTEGQPELIATLSGHSEKIVGLAWSPHYNARLVSASYDYTVQVWNVETQSCLGVYLAHNMAVMCALFSPQDPDLIISGSVDNTVRLWSTAKLPNLPTKPERKKCRVGNALKERSGGQEATELIVDSGSSWQEKGNYSPNTSVSSVHSTVSGDRGKEDYKKRQKSRAVFTVTGSKLAQAQNFDSLLQRWLGSPPADSNSTEPDVPSTADLGYLDFFGDDKAMRRLLLVEENQLTMTKQHQLAQHSALWRGDVSEMVRETITKKQLTDWLVSIAPLAGFDIWEEACAAYADQLVECGEVSKASSYLLAIHKVHEAVRLLMDYKLYREAVAVAKCRLPADDPIIAQVYTDWGHSAKQQGLLTLAAHCFLVANNVQACIETLSRVKELKSLKMAARLAHHEGQVELASSLAEECLMMCIVAGNQSVGYQLITDMPQYQHWNVWLRCSELLAQVKNRNEVEVFAWLEGLRPGHTSLLEQLAATCLQNAPVYHKLLPHLPANSTPTFERDMWSYVSGQLAAASAAQAEATPAHSLRHLVQAMSAAYYYQMNHTASLALPLTASLLTPQGLFAEGSIFTAHYETSDEEALLKSLKAFICASIVDWMRNNVDKVIKLQSKNTMEQGTGSGDHCNGYQLAWLPEMLKSCSADVLDADNVSFFMKKALREELQNIVNKENIQNKCEMKKEEILCKETTNSEQEMKGNDRTISVNNPKIINKIDENLNVTGTTFDKNEFSIQTIESPSEIETERPLSKIKTQNQDTSVSVSNIDITKIKGSSTAEDNSMASTGTISNVSNGGISSKNDSNYCSLKSNLDFQETKDLNFAADSNSLIIKNETVIDASDDNSGRQEAINSKSKEIKELDEVLQKFQLERVSVPSPFTAYVNIKYLLDNVVSKQDADLAQNLQQTCDQLWKKSKK